MQQHANPTAAIEFLTKFNTSWVLTAIDSNKKQIQTVTFSKGNLDNVRNWLETCNTNKKNVYFHVNPVLRNLSSKANREDIKCVSYLHVDIDPIENKELTNPEDIKNWLASERNRILLSLTKDLPVNIPQPTVITFSGGGYQAFWKLKTPILIDGDLGLAEEAKRYNVSLENVFGGDNCHNIDRIMRLPGTINVPDSKKRKKGREEELSKVIIFNDNVYDISKFSLAPLVQVTNMGFSSESKVKISGNVTRIADLSELDEWNVPDRVKVIIVQGNHPDQPKETDNSRSAWLFDAVCWLVRSKVPDEVIFSIITDPAYAISDSVLEQKGSSDKYAIRQINKAKEFSINPFLAELNEKFAVIGNIGGKCRIIEEVTDPVLKRSRLTKLSFEDFRNRYMNKKIEIGADAKGNPLTTPLGKWWLLQEDRRQFDTVVFAPEEEIPNSYNLWRGFSCPPIPGDCSKYLEHLKVNICSSNEEHYNYLINWMARAVQQPASAGEVAIVLCGGRGTGKSFAAKKFGGLFGRHFLQISNSGHLVGQFNAHLRDTVLLFADEAFFAGDRKHTSVLKTLITEEMIAVESKGVDVETSPNYTHLIMASNEEHVIPAGADERRFFVLSVSNKQKQNSDYFEAINTELKNGGSEALLYYLRDLNISEFNVRNVPQTEALREQKLLSLSPEEEWWYQKLEAASVFLNESSWRGSVPKQKLIDDYLLNAQKYNILRRCTATSLGRFLKKFVPGLESRQVLTNIEEIDNYGITHRSNKRIYHFILGDLKACRQRWEQLFGEEKWETTIEDEAPEINF